MKKRIDDSEIRIRIPLHIIASLPLVANKMTATKKKGGRKSRKGNYLPDETMFLLDILQRVRPIGPEEWQQCANKHTARYIGCGVESIRRKFSDLYKKSVPTGDPNCREDVKQAKRIKWAIGDRAADGDGEEEFNLEDTSFTARPDPNAPPLVADPPLDDDSDDSDHELVAAPPALALAPPPERRHTLAKRTYRGKEDPKQDFVQLMQMNMLQQQQERSEDRKERAVDRQQMMALMMAMISGRQPPPRDPPPVPPPPAIELDGTSNDSNSDLDLDNILEPASVPKRAPVAPPVGVGVVTQHHKKKRGLGNSSSSTVEVSGFI